MNNRGNNLRYRKYYYIKTKKMQNSLKKAAAFFVISVILFIATIIYALKDNNVNDKSNSMSVSENHSEANVEDMTKKDRADVGLSDNIRVVIKSSDFKDVFHNNIQISASTGLNISTDDNSIVIKTEPGEVLNFSENSQLKSFNQVLHVQSAAGNDGIYLNSVKRSCGYPAYYGSFDIYCEKDGYIIVNEVPLENYLYGVVPSEMPDSYDLEALKAQAVCARSYAIRRMYSIAYPEYNAAVDDSVRFQVYNNYEITEKIKEAVDLTKGEVIVYNGEVIDAYFYATSCGMTGGGEVWSEESGKLEYLNCVELTSDAKEMKKICSENDFEKFILNNDSHNYDSKSPWYRWQIKLDVNKLGAEWTEKYGAFKRLEVISRSGGGIITKLNVVGENASMLLSGEYAVRDFLGKLFLEGKKQNGEISNSGMLPSACFYVASVDENILTIKGGGYGHGVGLSQTAADAMAKSGLKYNKILGLFYPLTDVKNGSSLTK